MNSILLAIDPVRMAEYLKKFLEENGYTVLIAEDQEELKKKLEHKESAVVCYTEPFIQKRFEDENLTHYSKKGKTQDLINGIITNKGFRTETILITDAKFDKFFPEQEHLSIQHNFKEQLLEQIEIKVKQYENKIISSSKWLAYLNSIVTLILSSLYGNGFNFWLGLLFATLLVPIMLGYIDRKRHFNFPIHVTKSKTFVGIITLSIVIIILIIVIFRPISVPLFWVLLSILFISISWGVQAISKLKSIKTVPRYFYAAQLVMLVFILVTYATPIINPEITQSKIVHASQTKDKLTIQYFSPAALYKDEADSITISMSLQVPDSLLHYRSFIDVDPVWAIAKKITINDSISWPQKKSHTFPFKLKNNSHPHADHFKITHRLLMLDKKKKPYDMISKQIVTPFDGATPIWLLKWGKGLLAIVIASIVLILKEQFAGILRIMLQWLSDSGGKQ